MREKHIPVLLGKTLEYLEPQKGESYLDLTAGYGGHATAILAVTGNPSAAVLIDRDENAVRFLNERFGASGVSIRHQAFADAVVSLKDAHQSFDLILADFGVSSPHLDEANRGFSFRTEGPLDMRMDVSKGQTVADLVNSLDQSQIEHIIRVYGEEPMARRIARVIVAERPFTTTQQLANLLEQVLGRRGKTHPATRTFQALRIAVNDELGQIQTLLENVLAILAPAGRLGIITFHSLEDRLVKQFVQAHAGDRYDADIVNLTKKPVVADDTELSFNPRARSAKLRVVAKK